MVRFIMRKDLEGWRGKKFDLHSTMVRFIMRMSIKTRKNIGLIYIPLWLDLLLNHKYTFRYTFL